MANINDFKIIAKKSLKFYNLLLNEINIEKLNITSKQAQERFGFYLFILDNLTPINDIGELVELITDTEFNSVFYEDKSDDNGIDAVYIDDETNTIKLFNFKYREQYKNKIQSINETILSTKFINALLNEDTSKITGKLKNFSEQIIANLMSNDLWKLQLYIISNEDFEIIEKDNNLIQLEKFYGLETISIGLNKISEFITLRPEPVNADLIVDNDAVMSFSESSISSSKSYVIRLPLTEIIRITCNDAGIRSEYNIEMTSKLADVKLDYSVLFDNVRGLVIRSKFNKNISETLKSEPSKFFMYNNGLTLIANDINAEPVNANKKVKIALKGIQVLNGGQTLRTIHDFNETDPSYIDDYLSNGEILVRIFKTSENKILGNKIAEFTNSQNSISNIDLKSLRSEQLQLEQYLDSFNIIYARKSGDTGIEEDKTYDYKISMERFGQLLFSKMGHPEKATNQKKNIFDKYYDDVFNKESFKIEESPTLINRYFEIKREYDKLKEQFTYSEQKSFYLIYLDSFLETTLSEKIEIFEKLITKYESPSGKEISDARKLIQIKFKEFIDKELKK